MSYSSMHSLMSYQAHLACCCAGYWTVQDKVERIQHFLQATNAVEHFDERRTMMQALLDREIARKQVCLLAAAAAAGSKVMPGQATCQPARTATFNPFAVRMCQPKNS